jgi:hypothetical protein
VGVWDSHNQLDNQPKLYYCEGSPENPANWHIDTEFSSTLGSSGPFGSIDSFAVYDDTMYLSSGKKLYSFNGTDWSIAESYDDAYAFLDMQVYDDKLYAGTANRFTPTTEQAGKPRSTPQNFKLEEFISTALISLIIGIATIYGGWAYTDIAQWLGNGGLTVWVYWVAKITAKKLWPNLTVTATDAGPPKT